MSGIYRHSEGTLCPHLPHLPVTVQRGCGLSLCWAPRHRPQAPRSAGCSLCCLRPRGRRGPPPLCRPERKAPRAPESRAEPCPNVPAAPGAELSPAEPALGSEPHSPREALELPLIPRELRTPRRAMAPHSPLGISEQVPSVLGSHDPATAEWDALCAQGFSRSIHLLGKCGVFPAHLTAERPWFREVSHLPMATARTHYSWVGAQGCLTPEPATPLHGLRASPGPRREGQGSGQRSRHLWLEGPADGG